MHWIPYIIIDICVLALLGIYLYIVYVDRKMRRERREGLQKVSERLNDVVKSFDEFKGTLDMLTHSLDLYVDTDGRTVWVNSDSQCVARCCPVSYEIIHPETNEMEYHIPPGTGLNKMKSYDYSLFVKKVAEYYGLKLTCERPKWAVK